MMSESARLVVNGAVYVAVMAAFLWTRQIRSYASRLPWPHRWFLGGFLGVVLIGQIVYDPRLTYPFVAWAMYGRAESADTVVFYRYEGRERSGNRVQLDALGCWRRSRETESLPGSRIWPRK
jgi:hypothetical protein